MRFLIFRLEARFLIFRVEAIRKLKFKERRWKLK